MPNLPPIPVDPKISISVAWLRKEDWQQWRELCPDLKIQADHDFWLYKAESIFKQYEAVGHRIQKVIIEPAEFLEWSRINGTGVDTNARAGFAAFKVI